MSKIRKRKSSSIEGINNVYTVETIYKKKIRNNKEPLYYIKWKDWDDKYNTWEPLSNILDHSLIETFEDEIRQKQKLRKEAIKNKKLDWDKIDYESDVKSESSVDEEVNQLPEQTSAVDDMTKDDNDKGDLTAEEVVIRPKICIKIPKYRLHPPQSSTVISSLATEFSSPEVEKPRNVSKHLDDEPQHLSRLSPIFFTQDSDLNKSIKDESSHVSCKSPKKHDSLKNSTKHLGKITDTQMRKPRKLLSINEYSAVIKMKKKHHKKSKHSKHRSENRVFRSLMDIPKPVICKEMSVTPKAISENPSNEKCPQLTLENKLERWPKSRLGEPVLKDIESKLENNIFKFHSQTTVTDVTVSGLCVTIKEMCYDDFIGDDSSPRFQLVRIPVKGDWVERYLGKSEEKPESDCQSTDNEEDIQIVENVNCTDDILSKKQQLDRFQERIIPGLRPPSRPRSVDSYRDIMDRALYYNRGIGGGSHYQGCNTPNKFSMVDDVITKEQQHISCNSPLNIVIDDCEEVDVVGGIESENNSYLSSLQSTRTTVTTQLRQARMTNQSPVSSIIESLWHSYSYNSPMIMPPLQAAPWVHCHQELGTTQPLPPQPQQYQQQYQLSRSSSMDTNSMLKYPPLNYYQQSSNLLQNLYLATTEETPIDLSLK